jgi:hypothetical protein
MPEYLNYKAMVEDALRGVVRAALEQIVESGLRANHQLYVSFNTGHPGVVVADYLRDKSPKEMTIVLQHQFWNLDLSDDGFDVTLSFNKVPERLTVPFAALTGFADPGVQFGLQFQADGSANMESGAVVNSLSVATDAPALDLDDLQADSIPDDESGETAKVVTLDQFRKK